MRRSIALAAALAIAGLAAPNVGAATYPGGTEGCTHMGGEDKPCNYKATRSGGYVGSGEWTVVIKRAGVTYTLTPKTHNDRCLNAIIKGDDVTVSAKGGRIAAGNPFPTAYDSVPVSTSDDKPGDFNACKKK